MRGGRQRGRGREGAGQSGAGTYDDRGVDSVGRDRLYGGGGDVRSWSWAAEHEACLHATQPVRACAPPSILCEYDVPHVRRRRRARRTGAEAASNYLTVCVRRRC